MNDIFQQALGIHSPWYIKKINFSEGQNKLDIDIDFMRGSRFADQTGQLCQVHDTVRKTWRHLNFFQHECYLHVRMPRIKCQDGRVKLIEAPWAGKLSGFTLLFEALLIQLCRAMPVNSVRKLTGVSNHQLWHLLDCYVAQARETQDLSNVRSIGIDETSVRKGHNYISLFVDLKQRRTLHISDGKAHDSVIGFVEHLCKHSGSAMQIKQVSCDMSPAFIKGVGENLPNAKITFDKFHLVKILNDAVDQVRRIEAKTNPLLKNCRYMVLKNDVNLTEKQKSCKEELKLSKANIKTVRAMNIRETFQQLYQLKNTEDFIQGLKKWYFWATHSRLEPIIKAGKTIKHHWDGVVRWMESRINNGILEGLNSLLQAAKRKARGYKNEHFKTIAYLLTGQLDFSRINTHLPT